VYAAEMQRIETEVKEQSPLAEKKQIGSFRAEVKQGTIINSLTNGWIF
jgi:hypothetical protein